MDKSKFKVKSVLGKEISVSEEYWQFIISVKHPSVAGKEQVVKCALMDADEVRQSNRDPSVFLYYLAYNKYWLCAVCKHENGVGFVITAYITDRVKEGVRVWKR